MKILHDNIMKNKNSIVFQEHFRDYNEVGLYSPHMLEIIENYNKSKKRKVEVKSLLSRGSFNILRGLNMSIYSNDYKEVNHFFNSFHFRNPKTISYSLHNLCFLNEDEYMDFFSEDNMGLPCLSFEDFKNLLEKIAIDVSKRKEVSVQNYIRVK